MSVKFDMMATNSTTEFCIETYLLPIDQILPDLEQQLAVGDAIVVAPPGAGKSTALPLYLLRSALLTGQKMIMLQPRRIAVRNIAAYLAQQLGEQVGETVGYRIKGESKVGPATRLEIVTEGILTRMLQHQPELPGIGLVIFDEFHERSIHADFSLALCLEVQQGLRDDLRLLVMSATLDSASLAQIMPQARLLQSQGKSYPVEIVYRPDPSKVPLSDKVSRLIIDVFALHQNDALVFLPGVKEIQSVSERLLVAYGQQVEIHQLYGELSKAEQLAAIQPSQTGKRKIVLATNIAETSLTIEGIELVINSGQEKVAVFQLNRGISHLQSQSISQASATQRAGRAGRLGPGTCYRLWSSEQHHRLRAQSVPEILQADMAPFYLESAVWGAAISDLALIDQPSAPQLAQAQQALQLLGMLDAEGKLNAKGRAAQQLGCHPNIANMLLHSQQLSAGHLSMACAIAALLENKDPLGRSAGAQLSLRLQFLLNKPQHPIWQHIRQWHKKLRISQQGWPVHDCALVLGLGMPQWLGKRRHTSSYALLVGSGAILEQDDPLSASEWLIVAHMSSSAYQQDDARIHYAEGLSQAELLRHFSHLVEQQDNIYWDKSLERIVANRQRKLGNIVLEQLPLEKPTAQQCAVIWPQVLADKGLDSVLGSEACQNLLRRTLLARQLVPDEDWPDLRSEALLANIADWLLPHLDGIHSWAQLSKLDCYQLLKNQFDWHLWQRLESLLPGSIILPSGRQHPLSYGEHGDVRLAVKLPELYGLQRHPCVAQDRVKLTIELLSPALRPIQTTQDLPGFWQGSYKQVQKEMKGRYPRHFWPDEPATAPATTTTKKHMKLSE